MRCDKLVVEQIIAVDEKFQSLLGFLMRCDKLVVEQIIAVDEKFQSLLGFLMRCDWALDQVRCRHSIRFNPCWVF